MTVDIDPYRAEIARRLGQLRTQFGYAQRDFGETLGLGQNIVFRAEGDLNVSVEALLKLALFYVQEHQINPDWLFNPDNSEVPQQHVLAVKNRRKVAIMDKMVEEMREKDVL